MGRRSQRMTWATVGEPSKFPMRRPARAEDDPRHDRTRQLRTKHSHADRLLEQPANSRVIRRRSEPRRPLPSPPHDSDHAKTKARLREKRLRHGHGGPFPPRAIPHSSACSGSRPGRRKSSATLARGCARRGQRRCPRPSRDPVPGLREPRIEPSTAGKCPTSRETGER